MFGPPGSGGEAGDEHAADAGRESPCVGRPGARCCYGGQKNKSRMEKYSSGVNIFSKCILFDSSYFI
jgi:hypothetical protein